MTWSECKLATLQTMFANEGASITADDSNQDYINAMPAKANEAMQQLTSIGRPLLRTFTVVIQAGAAEEETSGKLVLPAAEVRYKLHMTDYCPDWRSMDASQLMLETAAGYGRAGDWSLEGDDLLVLPGNVEGTYTVWYHAYPVKITSATADEQDLGLPEEAAVLVPLYIAAELYKEDELAMATMFRNEFEDGLTKLRQAYLESAKGGGTGRVKNTTGWW